VGEELDRRRAKELSEIARLALEVQPTKEIWPQNSAIACSEPTGAAKHIQFHRDLVGLAGLNDLSGKSVLDVGSGFGLSLVTFGLLGAKQVRGIEYLREAVDAAARYLSELPGDLAVRIESREGDAAAMPYETAMFDVVFSVEAVSHYADVSAFLREAARVLKPGGFLLIADGNNGANPLVARKVRAVWRAFECGEPDTQVGDHRVLKSFRDMRRELLTSSYPQLADDELNLLAHNTAGLMETDVRRAAELYIATGRLPEHPYRDGDLAMSPRGIAIERLFHPRKLAREIDDYGFRARALGYWGGAGGRSLVRAANGVLASLTRVSIPFAPAFRIVAQRL
jgi:2-polyprenyl-3-methyl-5-hydroxy-6-metoxy-1,4-benzoquinol methylase